MDDGHKHINNIIEQREREKDLFVVNMPTLIDMNVADDASETILFEDQSTMLLSPENNNNENESPKVANRTTEIMDESTILFSPDKKSNDKNVHHQRKMLLDDTYEEESTIMSRSVSNLPQQRQPHSKEDSYCLAQSRKNQEFYRHNYQDFVKRTISDFQHRHPGQLRDYRLMSNEEKGEAQRSLLDLLANLGITKGSQEGGYNCSMMESQYLQDHRSSPRGKSQRNNIHPDPEETTFSISPQFPRHSGPSDHQHYDPEETVFSISPQQKQQQQKDAASPVHQTQRPQNDSYIQEADQSAMLLSPGEFQPQQQDEPQSRDESNTSFGFHNDNYDDDDDDDGDESVELPRADKSMSSYGDSYESPERFHRPNPQKRNASSSGKRGADTVRLRIMSDEELTPPPADDPNQDSEIMISSRMGRLSISPASEPRGLFEASQSPIAPRPTYGSSEDEGYQDSYRRPSNSQRRHQSRSARESEVTIDTVELTQRKRGSKDKRRVMRDIPVNIKMAPGATFYLNKLPVKRSDVERPKKGPNKSKSSNKSRMRRWVNFPDPLVSYNKKQKQILNDIYQWIDETEKTGGGEDGDEPSGNVIFSLSHQHIMNITLKLLLNESSIEDQLIDVSSKPKLQGQTIIVVRSKEDTSKWETALREGTGCSVLNHATLSLTDRIRTSTGEKATKYDVVLTTFDTLKSPDIAIPVNERGHALESKSSNGDGWFSNRSSDDDGKQKCKQLSVLHRIVFKRIIFADILGRKSFLAKHGTARAAAAVALRGESRLLFFAKSEEQKKLSALVALKKSDRRALVSLLALLRLDRIDYDDDEQAPEERLDEHMIDPAELV